MNFSLKKYLFSSNSLNKISKKKLKKNVFNLKLSFFFRNFDYFQKNKKNIVLYSLFFYNIVNNQNIFFPCFSYYNYLGFIYYIQNKFKKSFFYLNFCNTYFFYYLKQKNLKINFTKQFINAFIKINSNLKKETKVFFFKDLNFLNYFKNYNIYYYNYFLKLKNLQKIFKVKSKKVFKKHFFGIDFLLKYFKNYLNLSKSLSYFQKIFRKFFFFKKYIQKSFYNIFFLLKIEFKFFFSSFFRTFLFFLFKFSYLQYNFKIDFSIFKIHNYIKKANFSFNFFFIFLSFLKKIKRGMFFYFIFFFEKINFFFFKKLQYYLYFYFLTTLFFFPGLRKENNLFSIRRKAYKVVPNYKFAQAPILSSQKKTLFVQNF